MDFYGGNISRYREAQNVYIGLPNAYYHTGGELTTKPLIFSGNRLELNVDTSAGGTVLVEIQDGTGKAIVGFTVKDADEINGNFIRKLVTWNGSSDISSLASKPIRLRLVMRDTKLYAFQFEGEEDK